MIVNISKICCLLVLLPSALCQNSTAFPWPSTAIPYNVVPVETVFKLINKPFTTDLLDKASLQFMQLQSNVSTALYSDLQPDIKSISVFKFSPGSIEVTAQFEVIKRVAESVSKVNTKLKFNICSGSIGSLQVDKTAYIFRYQDLDCKAPDVKIINLGSSELSATQVKRSESYITQTSIKLNCNDSDTSFKWFVWALNLSSSSQKFVGNGMAEWTMTKQTLDYGVYMVVFNVAMTKTGISSYDAKYLSIVKSPLIAQILGGSHVKRGFNQTIHLDASPSQDPDVTIGIYTAMTFTWLCKKKAETFPTGPVSGLSVVHPDGVKGRGGCFDTGIGKLSSTARQATINRGSMQVDNSYTIKLVISKSGRTGFYDQLLEVVSGDPPQMAISCLINCGVRVSSSSRLKVTSKCISPQQACNLPLRYQWSMKRLNSSTNSWNPVSNFAQKFSTSLDSPDAVIKANSFRGSDLAHKYRLSVVASSTGNTPGISSYDFWFNSPPHNGTCEVSPTSGHGLQTDFTFECKNWQDGQDKDLPLKYQFYYVPEVGLTNIISYGAAKAASKLPTGKEKDSYAVMIYFRIIDGLSTFTEVTTTVTVTSVNSSLYHDQTKKVLKDSSKQVGSLLKSGDVKQATQLANAFLDTMSSSTDSVLNSIEKTEIIDDILEQILSKVQPNNLQTLTQVTSVIGRATTNPEEVSQSAEDDTIKALDKMTILLAEKSNDSSAAEDFLVKASGENLALCLGNVMRSSSTKARITDKNQNNKEKSIKVAETSVRLVNNVGVSLLKRKVVGEQPSIVLTASLSLVLSRQRPSDLEGTKLAEGGNSFVLPSKDVLGGRVHQLKFIDSQVTFTKFNPFTWDATANSIKSAVTSMVLRNDQSQDILVKDLSQDIQITIAQKGPSTKTTLREKSFIKPGTIRSYKYYISHPGTGLELNVTVEGQSTLSILVRRGEKPTSSSSDFRSRITDIPSCEPSSVLLVKACKKANDLVFLSAKLLQEKDVYYVGLLMETSKSHSRRKRSCFGNGRQKRPCVEPKDPPKPEKITIVPIYDPNTDMNYSISSQKYSCKYWCGKQWISTGCKAGPNCTTTQLQCLCNHLTSFGGSLLIEPNPIDFDHVLLELTRLDESGNVAVLATVLIFLFLYFVVAIIARRADRRDIKKFGPPITVSSINGGFQYEMIIETGVWRKSGTTSNVAIVIHGANATSDQIVLSPNMVPSRLMFATGNADKFVLSLPVSLGSVEYLNVWHDNSGHRPSWNLKHIAIKDMQTGSSWFFLHKDWLSLEKGDGQINKILVPTSPLEMRSFKYSFNHRTTKKFTEDHLWLSVLTKPPYSNFTRLQRATCCLVVLFSVMIVNAMFYKTDKTPDPRIQVGPLKFSWRQVMVGIYSSLIVLPIGMGIVLLFKNSRRKKTSEQRNQGLKTTLSGYFCCCCKRSTKVKISDSREHLTTTNDNDHCGSIAQINGCVFVSWVISIVTVFVAASFTFIYSLQWGKEIANQWLSSILVSFTQDLFVVQPLKICIVSIFLSRFLRRGDTMSKVTKTNESPKHAVEDTNPLANKTKTTTAEVKMNIIEEIELEETRAYQLQEENMFSFIREAAIYGVFFTLLTIVCYGNRSYLGYAQTNTIMNDFSEFTEIRTGKAYWEWIESQFVDSAYAGNWYNGAKESNEVYIGNKYSILLGMPRIRQLRIKPDTCIVPEKMRSMISNCYEEYSSEEDTTPLYLPRWKPLPNSHLKWDNKSKLCPKPWRYSTAKELSLLPSWGYHYLYSGGGYVVDLGYKDTTSSYAVTPLSNNHWIDLRTRALLLEFSVFNPSSNLVSTVTFYYEVLPFMFGYPFRKVETVALYGSESASYSFFLVCKLLFIFLVFFMLAREARRAYKMRRFYFKMFWNWFEVLQVIMAGLVVVCYVVKEKKILDAIQLVQVNPYVTVNFHSAIAWKYAEDVALSIAVFLATVKILRLMRFNSHIIIFSSSLKNARSTLISYSVILFVVIMAFAVVCKLSMGASMNEFRTFKQAIYTHILLSLGVEMDMTTLKDANIVLGPVTHFSYKLVMTFFFVNFYVAVITDSYEYIKSTTDRNAKEFEMSDFTINRFKEMLLSKKDKFPGSRKNSEAPDSDEKLSDGGLKEEAIMMANNNCEQDRSDIVVIAAPDDLSDVEKGINVHNHDGQYPTSYMKHERSDSPKVEILTEIKHEIQWESRPSRINFTNDYDTSQENQEENNKDPDSSSAHSIQHQPKTKTLKSSLRKVVAVKNFKEGIVKVKICEPVEEENWDIEEKGSIIYEQTTALAKEDNKEDIEYLKIICLLWKNLMLEKYQTTQQPSTPAEIGQENEGYESDGKADSSEESGSDSTYQYEDEDEDEMWGDIETMLKDVMKSRQPRILEHLRMKNVLRHLLKK